MGGYLTGPQLCASEIDNISRACRHDMAEPTTKTHSNIRNAIYVHTGAFPSLRSPPTPAPPSPSAIVRKPTPPLLPPAGFPTGKLDAVRGCTRGDIGFDGVGGMSCSITR